MRNLSRMPQNDDEYTVAFSMEGDTEGLNGTMSLATIRVSATVDTELDPVSYTHLTLPTILLV